MVLRMITATIALFITWSAQNAAAANANAPTVIASFETPQSLELWTGLVHSQTEANFSSGRYATSFTVPKWDGISEAEARPGLHLLFNDGKGFPFRDFSKFGSIAVDAWVVGDKPGKLGLKIIDAEGTSSWTTHITVEPGRKNEAVLTMADAAADCDIANVNEIVLYALRPETTFTLAVDNLRLLPEDTPTAPSFRLMYPNYRQWIFPDGPAVAVQLQDPPHETVASRLKLEMTGREVSTSKTFPLRKNNKPCRAELAHDTVPAGNVRLIAQLFDQRRNVITEQAWDLKKLTAQEVTQFSSYVDAQNNLVVDGKPFFPIGWYTSPRKELLDEIVGSPFNTLLPYGTNHVSKNEMISLLDTMQQHGMKMVYCMNDVYPGSKLNIKWEGITGNENVAAAALDAYKNHPAILAWYLNDELPREMAPDLEKYYQRFKTNDPGHPCFIVLCNRKDFPYLEKTTDILGGDPYPIPREPVLRVSQMMDKMNDAVLGSKPAWFVPQAFAWYQYNSKNTDRGHTPSETELNTGRAPTYDEERCMTYLGLVHGAKALIYYCYYDMRVLPQHEEMWAWMKKLAAEVKELSPVLMSPDDSGSVKVLPENAAIHVKLKRHKNNLYLLAVNPTRTETNVKFATKTTHSISVLFEDRTLSSSGRSFKDAFAPLAVHVYDLGPVN